MFMFLNACMFTKGKIILIEYIQALINSGNTFFYHNKSVNTLYCMISGLVWIPYKLS